MKWSELSSTKRDLLITIGAVNRDPDRVSSGTAIISELRRRYDYSGRREGYYVALSELADVDLVDKDATALDGRTVSYQLTPTAVRLIDEHRADVDDSVRVLA
uniref:hypothetical protein n=1 Tax=Halorubrum sp. T3 TaxID=1194088 RepID=UPI00042EAF1B|nr:hypothetical protein [Halorubrum sp. T3]AGI12343.1 putative transcriptional regulator [Halorubrum sp. T3]